MKNISENLLETIFFILRGCRSNMAIHPFCAVASEESINYMGKLRKPHKGRTGQNPKTLATADLEKNAYADMGKGNFSRAKEWLKELCKRDRERYLPQLIECYEGLARQMTAKGLHREARVVHDQIRLLSGGQGTLPRQEAPKEGTGDVFVANAAALIEQWSGSTGTAAAGSGSIPAFAVGSPCANEDRTAPCDEAAADALVVAFAEIPHLRETLPEVHREWLAVQQALSLISSGDFDAALREAKTIHRQSAFTPWRLYITGLCAFYTHHDDRAWEAFSRIPSNSLAFRASRPYLFILEAERPDRPRQGVKESVLVNACRILHHPELEHVLPRAEYLWQAGRQADSCGHVFRSAKQLFGEDNPLANTLARFYFHAALQMESVAADLYLRKIGGFVSGQGFIRTGSLHLARIRALSARRDPRKYHEYIAKWEEYLRQREGLQGKDDRMRALVCSHLGDFIVNLWKGDYEDLLPIMSSGGKRSLFYRLALSKYQESLDFNPGDRDVHLKILDLYEKAGNTAARNKKLDEITRLFPDDRDVLVKNGRLCIERKAFLKGIAYLKRALILNPLEGKVREYLIIGCIKAALHALDRGKKIRYRGFMQDALETGEPGLHNFNLCHPYLLVRWAVMEWLAGEEVLGNELYGDALDRSAGDPRLVYFACLIASIYGAPPRPVTFLEQQVKEIFKTPSPAVAAALTEIIHYIRQMNPRQSWFQSETRRLTAFALKAAALPCTVEAAKCIVNYAYNQTHKEWGLIKTYVDKMLEADPRHPWFLYYRYLCSRQKKIQYEPGPQDLATLEEILALAVERHDRLLIEQLNKIIVNMKNMMSPPVATLEDEDDLDENDDFHDGGDKGSRKIREIMEEIEAFMNMTSSGRRGRRARQRLEKRLGEAKDDLQTNLFDDF